MARPETARRHFLSNTLIAFQDPSGGFEINSRDLDGAEKTSVKFILRIVTDDHPSN
jgi:hypothetical protein